MNDFFRKMRGGEPTPPKQSIRDIAASFLGSLLAIGLVALLTTMTKTPWVLGSFGASCVLLFGFPQSPFSQPRNVIGGHLLTTVVALTFLSVLGSSWWSLALALSTAIALMHFTRTVHPPAGSNPVIIMLSHPGWSFLLTPTLCGAITVLAVALVFNNLRSDVKYPCRWG